MKGVNPNICVGKGGGDAVYGLGFIGALVYFLQNSPPQLADKLVAILKAVVWPAFAVFKLLDFLNL